MNITCLKKASIKILQYATLAALWNACNCSHSTIAMDGGGSRGGNPIIVGTIVKTGGAAGNNVRVSVIPEGYDPVEPEYSLPMLTDTTDSLGSFAIQVPSEGSYNIEAVDMSYGQRLLKFSISAIADSTVILPKDTLHVPGSIKMPLSDSGQGYLFVPGTTLKAFYAGNGDTVLMDSVPAGILPELRYLFMSSKTKKTVRYNMAVCSQETTLIENPEWSHCIKLYLNTSPSGASVTGDVYDFPVLVRLNSGNFDFTQAEADGSDCMFTGNGNSRFASEIERWNAAEQKAEIWVKVDTIRGNNSDQSINMYWGNTDKSKQQTSGHVFDTVCGFQGVWHLGDTRDDTVRDATLNGYYGVSPSDSRPSIAEGIIATCNAFDGEKTYISMPNTASGKLNFEENASYTVSAWIYMDTLDNVSNLIVSKGYEQYYLRLNYIMTGSPLWEFAQFNQTTGWQTSSCLVSSKQWVLLTGIHHGTEQYLYCNDVLVDSTSLLWANLTAVRNTSNDLSIGSFLQQVTNPVYEGRCFFRGSIDEVRISSKAQSNNWIRLCYMNQKAEDLLIRFK
jgi:hypothetical protein